MKFFLEPFGPLYLNCLLDQQKIHWSKLYTQYIYIFSYEKNFEYREFKSTVGL